MSTDTAVAAPEQLNGLDAPKRGAEAEGVRRPGLFTFALAATVFAFSLMQTLVVPAS